MNPTIAFVIVNFNAGEALAATLASLPGAVEGLHWEAVVVDNQSSDGSERAAERSGAQITLLKQTSNVGFAKGVNAGVAATSAPFVLVLNPDCRLERGAASLLLQEIERHPRCAVIGPRILDPDGALQESARGDPTLLTGVFGRTSFLSAMFPSWSIVRKNLAAGGLVQTGQSSHVVDWISGACMLVRRKALEEVAGFDEGYFLYWEDADVCRRIRGAGWDVRYMPEAAAVHEVGQSSRTARVAAHREFHRSAYRYYTTHVIPQPWHPGRPVAWLILTLRSMFKSLPL